MLFQPRHAVHVEVVGGLVHDQQVGGRQQQAGQGDAHPPATGHLAHRAIVVGGVETEPGEDPVGIGFHGVAADLFETRLGFSELGQQVALFVAGGRANAFSEVLDACRQLGDRPSTQHHLFEHRPAGLDGEFLGEVADPQVAGSVDLAGVGLLEADDGLDQRGLAGAVTAHQGYATPGPKLQGYVAE